MPTDSPDHLTPFDPLTADDLAKVLGLTIKRDRTNKLVCFLCQLSAYTHDSQLNVGFHGPSSSGKSHIPIEIARLFPAEDVKEVGYCSPTAFFHDVGAIDKEKGGYVVDLSRKILIFLDQPHSLLLQHLRPLLSHDKREIGMKITDKKEKAGLRTKNIYIRGFPTVIFCTTGLKLDEQESTRFILLSPETSTEKIRQGIRIKIRKETDRRAYNQWLDEHPGRRSLMERIRAIRDERIEEIRIGNPKRLEALFLNGKKALKPRHQRDIGKLISLVKGFALLNLWHRERDGSALVTNDQDIDEAFGIWRPIGSSQELGLAPYLLQVCVEVVLPAWEENEHNRTVPFGEGQGEQRGLTRPQIIQKHFQVYGRALADWQLRQEMLPMWEMAGLVRQELDPEDRRRLLIYPTALLTICAEEEYRELDGGVALDDQLPEGDSSTPPLNSLLSDPIPDEAEEPSNAPSLKAVKAGYNNLLRRQKELAAYLDDEAVPHEMKKERLGEFRDLIERLSQLAEEIKGLGYPMSSAEILNGFDGKGK